MTEPTTQSKPRKKRETKTYRSLDDLPLMLSVYDLMDFFNKGQKQAYEMVHSEGFPAMKDGVSIVTPKWLLIDWIEEQVKKGVSV